MKERIPLDRARQLHPGVLDVDLDATWAKLDGSAIDADPESVESRRKREENMDGEERRDFVTIVRAQWYEFEDFWRVVDPLLSDPAFAATPAVEGYVKQLQAAGIEIDTNNPTMLRMSPDAYQIYQKFLAAVNIDINQVKKVQQARKVYKQAWIGRKVLPIKDPMRRNAPIFVEECPNPKGFSFHCITAEPDETKGTWFGLISVIRDPQRWANKWATQIITILNTTAKGGIIAERDAFDDPEEAEKNYAAPDAITWAATRALSGARGSKIMSKPGAGNINGLDRMLQMALEEIRQASGVNHEILGLRDVNQPGVLEAQRKQAAMTILATVFDSLRRMRRSVGHNRLHYIQAHFADGRLVPILGDRGREYIKLIKDKVQGDYDVVVEDAPTSPNQKQETWAIIVQMLPVIRDKLTPEMWVLLLEYSPLPSKLVEALKEMISTPPDPKSKQREAIADANALADAEKKRASAAKDRADAEGKKLDGFLAIVEAAVSGMQVAQANQIMRQIPGQASSRPDLAESDGLAGVGDLSPDMPAGATVN